MSAEMEAGSPPQEDLSEASAKAPLSALSPPEAGIGQIVEPRPDVPLVPLSKAKKTPPKRSQLTRDSSLSPSSPQRPHFRSHSNPATPSQSQVPCLIPSDTERQPEREAEREGRMAHISWAFVSLEARISDPTAIVQISENQVAFVGGLQREGHPDDAIPLENTRIACVIVTRKSDGTLGEEVIVLPFRDPVVSGCMAHIGGRIYMFMSAHWGSDELRYSEFTSEGSVVALSLDTRECTVYPASEVPVRMEPALSFVLGDIWYIVGSSTKVVGVPNEELRDDKHTKNTILTYDTLSNEWGELDLETGIPPGLGIGTVVGDIPYFIGYKYDAFTLVSYGEGEGFKSMGGIPEMMYVTDMVTVGRHFFLRATEDADGEDEHGPVRIFSYSSVSQEWTEYPAMDSETEVQFGFCAHIGGGVLFFVNTTPTMMPTYLTGTVTLPPGDDYESAGRWNVMDPDHQRRQ
ncbi:LOW QUALITY PROTEIN: hypothetical protein KIPB_000015 [Kipferlia bialata]|uniref:Uncharacterized protein n=1 Tax=Kipferlia bialata TaxID=797122 RepID=A0A9K3CNH8_9EUKA|nr:LOW QUALITY PROTEIN: hypothetical protein KIPB_000015 [Kipferlia bialata]